MHHHQSLNLLGEQTRKDVDQSITGKCVVGEQTREEYPEYCRQMCCRFDKQGVQLSAELLVINRIFEPHLSAFTQETIILSIKTFFQFDSSRFPANAIILAHSSYI